MTIKRAHINPSQDIIRVSVPGVDLDTATKDQLLLDETAFTAQIIQIGYVPNPLNESTLAYLPLTETLPFRPYCFGYILTEGKTAFPHRYLDSGDAPQRAGGTPLTLRPQTHQIEILMPRAPIVSGAYVIVYRYPHPAYI